MVLALPPGARCDPRLADWPAGAELPADLWTPDFIIQGDMPDQVLALSRRDDVIMPSSLTAARAGARSAITWTARATAARSASAAAARRTAASA